MTEQKPRRLSLTQFPGLINNTEPRDLPSGAAQTQINFTARTEGLLSSRRGFKVCASDSVTLVDDLAAEVF